MLHAGDESAMKVMRRLCSKVHKEEHYAGDWRHAIIVLCTDPQKTKTECGNPH